MVARKPGGKSVKGASGPALGAVFKGNNKNGIRRWSTNVTVIACEPGKVFEFAVTSGPLEVANWRYEFEDTESGCRVTESWEDRRKSWFVTVARVMGDHGRRPRRAGDGGDAGQPGRGGRVAAPAHGVARVSSRAVA